MEPIEADTTLPFPRPVVYAAYRDRLDELVDYLPNVRGIEIKSREEDGSIVRFLNIWHGGGDIPKAARAFVSENMLTWSDHAEWDESKWTCKWRIETHSFTEAVTCEGLNHFVENPDGSTTLQVRGSIAVDARKVKGVPRLLAGKAGKMVEDILANKIRPNLLETSVGLGKFLAATHKG